jgi:hypothetical protein
MALVPGNKTITGNHILKHNDQGRSLLLACTTKTFEMFSTGPKPTRLDEDQGRHRTVPMAYQFCPDNSVHRASGHTSSRRPTIHLSKSNKQQDKPAYVNDHFRHRRRQFSALRKTQLRQGRRNSNDHSDSVNKTPHTKQMASSSPIRNCMNGICRSADATKTHYRKNPMVHFLDRQNLPVIWNASTSKRVLQTAMCDPNRLTAAVQSPQPIRAVGR